MNRDTERDVEWALWFHSEIKRKVDRIGEQQKKLVDMGQYKTAAELASALAALDGMNEWFVELHKWLRERKES